MKNTLVALWVGTLILLIATVSHAQESTAGSNLQSEASWSALKSLIGKAQGEVDLVEIDLNAIKNCSKQGKIYNGTTCITAVYPTDPRITNIITCGNQGRVYSQAQNACIEVTGGNRWYAARSGPATGSSHLGGSSYAYNRMKNLLNDIKMPICGSDMQVGRKCSPVGKECAVLDRSERPCGSQGDNTCYSYSSLIHRCD